MPSPGICGGTKANSYRGKAKRVETVVSGKLSQESASITGAGLSDYGKTRNTTNQAGKY